MIRRRFTVVIPTLQKAPQLPGLIEECATHPLVEEVLIINNSGEPLRTCHSNVRVFDQDANIFVNPAWNLGAKEARSEWLAILNDDIELVGDPFTLAARTLGRGFYGIVGFDRSAFTLPANGRPRVRIARVNATSFGYGVFMCLRAHDFVPIPEEMKIWGGDDWLILHQHRPPAVMLGVGVVTKMGTSTEIPAAQRMRRREQEVADRILGRYGSGRWWQVLSRCAEALRYYPYILKRRFLPVPRGDNASQNR